MRPPEANDILIKAGTGVGTMMANQAAWAALGAAHHGAGVASTINTAATSASWLGPGSAASATNVTLQNTALHGLAGWVDAKPPVAAAAVGAYTTANAAMRPAAECQANRDEWTADNHINPAVWFTLTPRIISLDLEYFGNMWPNNSAVGASYGATLSALAASLAIPPALASMGASPAAPAEAAAAIGQSAADTAAGDGMRSAFDGVSTLTGPAGQGASAAQDVGGQVSSLMGPMQSVIGAAPQALQEASGVLQAPMGAMGSVGSLTGMFASPGAGAGLVGLGSAAPTEAASAASTVGGVSAAGGSMAGGAGGVGFGGAGVPATSFTRPVSAFEPGGSGRPVGLRPSGALGAEAVRAPTTTTGAGSMMGGMPVGHAGGGQRGSGKYEQPTTVRVIDDQV